MSTTVKRESTDNNTAKPSIKRNKSVKSEAVNGSVDAPASAPPTADDATLVPDLEDCGFEDSELPKVGIR